MGLKDLFFKDTAPKKDIKQPSKAPVPISTGPIVAPMPVQGATDYNAHFEKVMINANLPGPDFHEFSDVITAYDSKPMAELDKYENAFLSFKSMGVTAQKLAETGEKYLQILNKDLDEFNAEMDETTRVNVNSKNEQADKIERDNIELQKQINENNLKAQKLKQEAFASKSTLDMEKSAYLQAFNYKVTQIQQRIQNIKTYLYDKSTK